MINITSVDLTIPASRHLWQDYVDRHPQATLHHELSWADAVHASFAHAPHLLMARRGSAVCGVFPLFGVRSVMAGKMLVSVPYGIYGGVLADDDECAGALLQSARDLARRWVARCIDIRSRQAMFTGLHDVHRYVTFVKDLPDSAEAVRQSLPRKARAEARRAQERFGLQARRGDEMLKPVWQLYCQSMRRLGSPNVPQRFFAALAAHAPGRHVALVVHDDGRPVAGLLGLMHRDTVMPYYSGCTEAAGRMGANNYLYLALMEDAVARGLRSFDFGRTRVDNRGAYEFKKNQGFTPTPLGYQLDPVQGRSLPDLSPANPRFRAAQWAWKRLPLAFTKPLGAWLSASIPG